MADGSEKMAEGSESWLMAPKKITEGSEKMAAPKKMAVVAKL